MDFIGETVGTIHHIARILTRIAVGERGIERIGVGTGIFVEDQGPVGTVARAGESIDERSDGIRHGDLAVGDFAVAGGIATAGQTCFVDQRVVIADVAGNVVDADRQGRGRRITVTIDDRVGEGVGRIGIGRIGRRDIAVDAGRGVHGQRAILALDHQIAVDDGGGPAFGVDAGEADDSGKAIGAGNIIRSIGQQVAANGTAFFDACDIVEGGRGVIVEHDIERGRDAIPIAVGHDEADRGGGVDRFVVRAASMQYVVDQGNLVFAGGGIGQFDREQHAARAGRRQDVACKRIGDLLGTDGCRRAIERRIEGHRCGRVDAYVEGEGAGEAGFAGVSRVVADIGVEIASGRIGIAADQAVIVHRSRNQATGRNRIGDKRDGDRRTSSVVIAIGNGVVESDIAFFARSGRVGEGPVTIVHQGASAAESAVDELDRRKGDAIGTGRVIGEDIDRDRGGFRVLRRGIVARDRRIVDDFDLERRRSPIAIGVDDGHREEAIDRFAQQVVGERVAETDPSTGEIDAGDRQRAEGRDEGLADGGDCNIVDQHRSGTIRRVEYDRTGGGFDIGFRSGTSGFGNTIDCTRGQARFIDRCDRGDRAGRIVRRYNHDHRWVVDHTGEDFLFTGLGEGKLGVRKQVAERVGVLDIANIAGEIATRALHAAGGGFGLAARQECRNVLRRDADAIDFELRDDDRAIRNADNRAIFERDDEVSTIDRKRIERNTCRETDDIVRPDDLGLLGGKARLRHGDKGAPAQLTGQFVVVFLAIFRDAATSVVHHYKSLRTKRRDTDDVDAARETPKTPKLRPKPIGRNPSSIQCFAARSGSLRKVGTFPTCDDSFSQ